MSVDVRFRDDLRASVGLWRLAPELVVVEGVLVLLSTLASAASGGDDPLAAGGVAALLLIPSSMASIAYLGWVGGQRVVMATGLDGRILPLPEVLRTSRGQMGRFLALGFLSALVVLPLTIVAIVAAVSADPAPGEAVALPVWILVAFAVVVFALDIVGTLMTPALALDTDRARDAVVIGWRLLRTHATELRWHVLVPPLALVALPATLGLDPRLRVAFGVVGAPVLLAVRGAVVRAYLRLDDREAVVLAVQQRTAERDATRSRER